MCLEGRCLDSSVELGSVLTIDTNEMLGMARLNFVDDLRFVSNAIRCFMRHGHLLRLSIPITSYNNTLTQ